MSGFVLTGVILLALTIGGSIVGVVLSRLLVPQSWVAALVGFFMLPGALALGLRLWWGLADFVGLLKLLRGTIRSRSLGRSLAAQDRVGWPGGRVVLILASEGVCLVGGIIIALLSKQHELVVIGGYAVLGLGYGVILFLLAGRGFFDGLLWEEPVGFVED